MSDERSRRANSIAAFGALLLLIALVLPGLPWLSYANPDVGEERAPLDERALAEAIITVPIQRGANGTEPDALLMLGDASYRMGDIAALFDLELPMPSVYTRREFRVTVAQLTGIHPDGRAPSLTALAAYDDDVEVPLQDILVHSELALPRPALHESAAVLVDLADLLDLLSVEIAASELLATAGVELPLTQAIAEEAEISLIALADLAGIALPAETPEAALSLSTLLAIAEIVAPLAEVADLSLNLPLADLSRRARLGWDVVDWAGIAGADLRVASLLEEARVDVPLEPATVQRSALGLLDDYLLRAPGVFSISLTLAFFVCLATFLLPAFGRRWRIWLAALGALPALVWLPTYISAQNPMAWDANSLFGSLAPGYWLAWLAVLVIGASALWQRYATRSTETN